MTYTVREFLQLTPFQKKRLQQRDPEGYSELLKQANHQFPKIEDNEALAEINKQPKKGGGQ